MASLPELAFDQVESVVLECIEAAKGRAGYCARHAVEHLQKAWRISTIDPEMAVFRGITAEEEAAAAILAALYDRGYGGASPALWRSHRHKQAVMPFMLAIAKFERARTQRLGIQPNAEIFDGRKRLFLRLRLPGSEEWVVPDPPLQFTITHRESGKEVDFYDQFEELANEAGKSEIAAYIKARSNQRNEILYASERGVPRIKLEALETELQLRRAHVFLMLMVFCLIEPYSAKADFAQQALNAFLTAVKPPSAK